MTNIQEILDNIAKKYPTNNSVVCESNKRILYVFSKDGQLLEVCKQRKEAELKYGWQTIANILRKKLCINGIWVSYTNKFEPRVATSKAQPKPIKVIYEDGSEKNYESRRICAKEIGIREDTLYNIRKGKSKTLPQGIKQIIF